MSKNVTVFLVDDHAVVREGYKHLLQKTNIDVIAEASSGEEAYHQFETLNPDVIVMDLSMPGIGGIETIAKIIGKNKHAKILAFSMHDDIVFCKRALQAGACGYVTKSSAPDELIEAVFTVAANKKFISQEIANRVSLKQVKSDDVLSTLTPREFEIFQMLAKGMSLDEIATTLHLDYKTIANAQTRLRQKLNVENTSQLILAAVKLKILPV
ncbi:MAG TPA: response regulator transcription factor [Methylotenera sp.]|nr:response regulator transcription factor [Methylotenera sp.]HPN02081.1 response regulator transcription factor [Methylotenera sp.]